MPHYPPANRDEELNLFDHMVAGQSAERILLLEADGGMGKTTLLGEFIRRCPPNVSCAPIDLKGSSIGLHDIFYRVCDALGWEYFPAFATHVEHLGQVTIGENVIIGRAAIEIALQAPNEGDQAARRAELTRAFFDDLRALERQVLLIFDTFNEAPPDVQEWLESSFLAFAHRTSSLTVVVAGRQVPRESIEWATCCIRHHLTEVRMPESWQTYAERIGAVLPSPDWIPAFCDLLEGHPLKMAKALARYVPGGG
jgi:ATP/maltotriose-dependent transcriptional regulator MalT